MCAFCITGAIDATADSNVLFGGETVFAYNTATYGGTSVKRSGLYCISGNAKHRFTREKIWVVVVVECMIAVAQILDDKRFYYKEMRVQSIPVFLSEARPFSPSIRQHMEVRV